MALRDVCLEVIPATHPELSEEEVRERAEALVEEFIRAFRLESASRRMLTRFRGRAVPPM
jgi:hypothetical protein